MDLMLLAKAAVMGVVEGLTEFLPISSTGHLILAGALLGFDDDKAKVFDIAIQTGAIFAVILVVASSFIVGGFIILWAERRPPSSVRIRAVEDMRGRDALMVGLVQCLAMVPGTSRSGATIIGGMLLGLSRKAATDFSFFLAIPTLIGAGGYSLYKERALLSVDDIPMFATGLVVSFISAWICVRWLLKYIASHSFEVFAWYRIAFGLVVLGTAWTGVVSWTA